VNTKLQLNEKENNPLNTCFCNPPNRGFQIESWKCAE